MEEPIKSESDAHPETEPDEFPDDDTEPEAEPAAPATASRTLNAKQVETHRVRPPLLRLLAGVLAVIIVAVLLVLGARWIYHKTHHTVNQPPSTSQKSPASSSQNKTSGNQPAGGTSSPAPATGSNPQITNTGPGDVAAIFASAGLAAGGLHYAWSLRRRANS